MLLLHSNIYTEFYITKFVLLWSRISPIRYYCLLITSIKSCSIIPSRSWVLRWNSWGKEALKSFFWSCLLFAPLFLLVVRDHLLMAPLCLLRLCLYLLCSPVCLLCYQVDTNVEQVERGWTFLEFHFPSKENDAVQMIWQAVARKVPPMRLKLNRFERISRSPPSPDEGLRSIPAPKNFWWKMVTLIWIWKMS